MLISPEYPILSNIALTILLIAGMIGLAILGRWVGDRYHEVTGADSQGQGIIETAILTLFGFLVALLLTAAIARFQERRALILQEAQAISTAYSRLDLLPEAPRKDLQPRFRSYLEARVRAYHEITSLEVLDRDLAAADRIGAEIWSRAAAACRAPETAVHGVVVLPPINQMLDLATARRDALKRHPPRLIYVFMFLLAGLCAYLSGFPMARGKRLSWSHVVAFALATGLTIFLTIDIENPRFGLIRVDDSDRLLRGVLEGMR